MGVPAHTRVRIAAHAKRQERNLLSVAYKNVVGARRASWRVLSSIESKEKEKGDHEKVTLITSYREKVEKELEKICKELLDVLEKFLLPEDKTAEGQVFYWKMAGDYWRYLAEFAAAEDRKGKAEKAKEKYEQVRAPRRHAHALRRAPPSIPLLVARGRRPRQRSNSTCHPPTPSDWALHSTSASSTMRF